VAITVGAWLVRDHGSVSYALVPEQLTSELGAAGQPSFSPDGSQIAYYQTPETGNDHSLYVKIIGVPGPPRRLTTRPGVDFSPAWSPDGRYVAFLRYKPGAGPKAAVLRVPLTGGPEQTLAEVSIWDDPFTWPVADLAWFPDDRSLVTIDRSSPDGPCGLFLLSVDTREKRKLTLPLPEAGNDATPAISPDGHWLAFSRGVWGVMHLFLVALGDDHMPRGEPTQITFQNGQQTNPVWTPDGREIVFVAGVFQNAGLWRVSVSGGHPGKPERLAFAGNEVRDVAISRIGRRLVFARSVGGGYQIWKIEASPAQKGRASLPVKFISSTQTDEDPAYSPDGKRIAFKSARSGSAMEIWVCDSDGANATQLTFSAAGVHNWSPRWSPDGRTILYSSNLGGRDGLYLVNSQGGASKRLTSSESRDGSFSRDGNWIYFASHRTGQFQIWKMPANGSDSQEQAVQVTRNGAVVGIESPDGKYLYSLTRENLGRLIRIPVEGGEEIPVLLSILFLNFAVADEGIYFIPGRVQSPFSLQFFSFATGKIAHVADIGEQGPGYTLEVSPGPGVASHSILYEQERPEHWNLMLVENFR
jgi:Tol biopolymer transport system component